MSKPKNMTPEQDVAWREKVAAYNKAWEKANCEKVVARRKAYYEANREKVAAQKKAWDKANPEKVTARRKAYYEAIHDVLTDGYVASTLHLPLSECPPSLLEMKREQLALHRLTKQLNEALKETTE